MYTKGEYDADLRRWQRELGNLTNDFEAVCKQLKYRNLMDTMSQLKCFAQRGLIDYPDKEYVEDFIGLVKNYYDIDLTKRIITKEEES